MVVMSIEVEEIVEEICWMVMVVMLIVIKEIVEETWDGYGVNNSERNSDRNVG